MWDRKENSVGQPFVPPAGRDLSGAGGQPRLLQSPALTMKEVMMVSKVICVSAFGWLVRVGGGGGRLLADKRAARQEDNEVTMTMPQQYKCTDPSVRSATREQSAVVKS